MQITSFGCSFTFGEELDDLPDWFNDNHKLYYIHSN